MKNKYNGFRCAPLLLMAGGLLLAGDTAKQEPKPAPAEKQQQPVPFQITTETVKPSCQGPNCVWAWQVPAGQTFLIEFVSLDGPASIATVVNTSSAAYYFTAPSAQLTKIYASPGTAIVVRGSLGRHVSLSGVSLKQ